MPTITFFLRKNRDNQQTHVLYCRVTLNRTTAEFSTKEKVSPEEWNQDHQSFKGRNKKQTEFVNTMMDSLRYKLKSATLVLSVSTAPQLIAAIKKTNIEQSKKALSLVELVESFIVETENSQKVAPGTIRNHNIKLKNLKAYEAHTKAQFTNESFDLPEAEKFKSWFMSRNQTKNVTTANRNVSFFAFVLQDACKKGLINDYRLSNHRGEKDALKPPVFLTLDEVVKLVEFNPANVMIQKAKDLYLFQISTGLSFGDIWSKFEIVPLHSGKAITGKRVKNQHEFFIPLDPMAEILLEKYGGEMPKYCNAVYNRLLKEIAALLGIDKRLTTHTGRKTFATMQDGKGWSRESIAMMLGHRSVKTTEMYYIGQSFSRIQNEFSRRAGQ